LYTSALIVFVEAMKELPITLLLRPLNIETLATWLYGEAARGTYEEGALAALLIIMVSVLPVMLLTRTQATLKKSQQNNSTPQNQSALCQ
jgi:iron(III) transport system permease protein